MALQSVSSATDMASLSLSTLCVNFLIRFRKSMLLWDLQDFAPITRHVTLTFNEILEILPVKSAIATIRTDKARIFCLQHLVRRLFSTT